MNELNEKGTFITIARAIGFCTGRIKLEIKQVKFETVKEFNDRKSKAIKAVYNERISFLKGKAVQMWCDCSNFEHEKLIKNVIKKMYSMNK